MDSLFRRWRDQPAAKELPEAPLLYDGRKVTLESNLLGCQITLDSENASPCIELAESVLATLESLLSTGFSLGIVSREPKLTISVGKSAFPERLFRFEIKDLDGRPHMEIRCGEFTAHSMTLEAQAQIRDKLFDMLTAVLARVFALKDPEETIARLFRDELALERSISFTCSFIVQGNVLGDSPKTKISAWTSEGEQRYSLTRTEQWDASDRLIRSRPATEVQPRELKIGKGEPPEGVLDAQATRHTEITSISLIREELWERARWSGTAFFTFPNDSNSPILAPIFENAEAAAQIFAQWREELGTNDHQHRLRVAIIRGVDRKHPFTYRIVIGANLAAALSGKDIRIAISVSRISTMEPSSDVNLERFLHSFQNLGEYLLAPSAVLDDSGSPTPVWGNQIAKRDLHVRDAWEIGRHDLDSVGVLADDDPIIPAGQREPPVRELLEWKRNR